MTERDVQNQETLKLLAALGQEHLLAPFRQPEAGGAAGDSAARDGAARDGAAKESAARELLEQVRALDAGYPGGLRSYIERGRELLASSRRGDNPFEGYSAAVPQGVRLPFKGPEFLAAEASGARVMNRCGFVLVAGGLGERLGFGGIKVALPAETATGRCFLRLYIETLLAVVAESNRLSGEERQAELAIMTSDDTHAATQTLLQENAFFGMDAQHVTLLKQDKVACLADDQGRLAQSTTPPYLIETKPHGHGDVHLLLHRSGVAARWVEAGLRYVLFFQDTNALAFNAMPATIGVCETHGVDVNSVVVPRTPGEAVGGIAELRGADRSLVINVEYNQLDALLRATTGRGDVADETGNSPYPGNINVLALRLEPYLRTLKSTEGVVPEFVNPKYADKERTRFSKATRLECMMQDYPKLLESKARVGFTEIERSVCFSSVKNNLESAAQKQSQGLPPESASSGEADLFAHYRRLLAATPGSQVNVAPPLVLRGVSVSLLPVVTLHPVLASKPGATLPKIERVHLSAESVLIIEAFDIEIRGLELEGALEIHAVPGAKVSVRGARCHNAGWRVKELPPDSQVEEVTAIRGFRFEKRETCVLRFEAPGDYVLEGTLESAVFSA